ncbi:RNA polymerase sigma factor [Hoyosella rhizosphaerae]|nr:RNA polymerase sigma factor [Hoyosella rhizosphaerae]MBN4927602.1 RNA polymerase sigma factor [Hoyosella rhizosphaerae]
MNKKTPFDRVVTDHGNTVLRVCLAVLSSLSDAEDAWSETFIAALRAYPELDENANLEAWLVTIAHRKALDVLRSRSRRAVPVGDVPEPIRAPLATIEPGQEIWEDVASLPPKQRQVIAYRFIAGLSYGEIANIIGGTPEAARRASSDGIAALRAQLTSSCLGQQS